MVLFICTFDYQPLFRKCALVPPPNTEKVAEIEPVLSVTCLPSQKLVLYHKQTSNKPLFDEILGLMNIFFTPVIVKYM